MFLICFIIQTKFYFLFVPQTNFSCFPEKIQKNHINQSKADIGLFCEIVFQSHQMTLLVCGTTFNLIDPYLLNVTP